MWHMVPCTGHVSSGDLDDKLDSALMEIRRGLETRVPAWPEYYIKKKLRSARALLTKDFHQGRRLLTPDEAFNYGCGLC